MDDEDDDDDDSSNKNGRGSPPICDYHSRHVPLAATFTERKAKSIIIGRDVSEFSGSTWRPF